MAAKVGSDNNTGLPFLDKSARQDAAANMARLPVNWTLDNAKRPHATVCGQQRFVHDVTRTADIDGARAASTKKYVHAAKFSDKPHFFLPNDVEGSGPRAQVPPRPMGFAAAAPSTGGGNEGGRDRALRTRDIEHCYPESKLFATPRVVDPLNPVYALPPARQALPPPEAPRRDPLAIDDIDGARAKKARVPSQTRNTTLDTRDIPLSTAGSLSAARKRKTTSRMLETRDITHPPELEVEPFLKNPRGTNPLSPVYRIGAPRTIVLPVEAQGAFDIGEVSGSKPKPRPQQRSDRPLLSLQAGDIVGARPRHLAVIRHYEYDERNGGSKRVAPLPHTPVA
jgi:hypothetical protein